MIDNLLKEQYEKDNYKVIDINDNKRCIIYCSSNGLWDYSEESFRKDVMENDKYEWDNLDKNKLLSYFGRKIFLRDIYLHFYVDGINNEINTIDKIISLLKELTRGFEITLVGYSAGGYLAMILGAELKAQRVFSFGGQPCLYKWGGSQNNHPFSDFGFLYSRKDDPLYNKWFDISEHIKNTTCIIYHFYSRYCEADIIQKNFIEDLNNVYLFALPTAKHGKMLWGFIYPYLFTAEDKKLQKYSKKHSGIIKKQIFFSFRFAGFFNTLKHITKKLIKRFLD